MSRWTTRWWEGGWSGSGEGPLPHPGRREGGSSESPPHGHHPQSPSRIASAASCRSDVGRGAPDHSMTRRARDIGLLLGVHPGPPVPGEDQRLPPDPRVDLPDPQPPSLRLPDPGIRHCATPPLHHDPLHPRGPVQHRRRPRLQPGRRSEVRGAVATEGARRDRIRPGRPGALRLRPGGEASGGGMKRGVGRGKGPQDGGVGAAPPPGIVGGGACGSFPQPTKLRGCGLHRSPGPQRLSRDALSRHLDSRLRSRCFPWLRRLQWFPSATVRSTKGSRLLPGAHPGLRHPSRSCSPPRAWRPAGCPGHRGGGAVRSTGGTGGVPPPGTLRHGRSAAASSSVPPSTGSWTSPSGVNLPPVADFVQRDPVDGGVPSERTEVRIAYDEDFLYFGFHLFRFGSLGNPGQHPPPGGDDRLR